MSSSVWNGLKTAGRRDHELDQLPVGVLLQRHVRGRELRREQVGDEVRTGIGVLRRDPDVGELLLDQGVGGRAQQRASSASEREPVGVSGLGKQVLRLLGIEGVVLVELGVVGVARRREHLGGDRAVVALQRRQHRLAVERVVERLANRTSRELGGHRAVAVEQQQALEVELVGVDRPAGGLDLGEVVVGRQLHAVGLAGLDRVERGRRGVEHVDRRGCRSAARRGSSSPGSPCTCSSCR